MRKVAVFTGTRAEYGLLYWIIKALHESSEAELQLLVGGMHLSPEFGYTVNQIMQDGFPMAERMEFLLSSDSPVAISKSMGLALINAADVLQRQQPDLLVILGDRFESMARFVNVAFSDGSLLHGFNQRLEKRQPIVAPNDIKRYFVTTQESGELCLVC